MADLSSATGTPGAQLAELRAADAEYVMGTYARQPIALVRGAGVRVWDTDGHELIDMVGGIAVNVLGHAHPALCAAIGGQASRLIHTSNLYYTEPQLELARRLVATAFPSRVFFCNSGAEANEAAIKLARKWGGRHRGGAHRIICAEGAFHGRTLAALAATGTTRYQEPFLPMPEGFVHVPFDDSDAVATAIDDTTAAVLLEPIQGESGVIPMADDTLRAIRQHCDQRGVLLILDEVQSGMGRTGRWWAHQHAGISPDVMTVAKGLGGGLPIGAVLAAPHADVFEPGDHGCTFGGNPLATAAALAVIDAVDSEGLLNNASQIGDHLVELLRSLPTGVDSVRGRGLMLAVLLEDESAPQVARAALSTGVIVNAIGGRVLRLVPPLTLSEADADHAVERLAEAIELTRTEGGA